MRRSFSPTDPISCSSHALSAFSPAMVSGRTMFSSAVSIGSRLKNWKMKPMCSRRSFVRSRVVQRGDLGAADLDAAAGRAVEPGEDVHQRRLARARRPHHGRQLAAGHVERHTAEGIDCGVALAVAAGDVLGDDDGSVPFHLSPFGSGIGINPRRDPRPPRKLPSVSMAEKRYLFTPGPTPVPPEVLAALAEPVVHHRGPDYRTLFGECLDRLRTVYRTAGDVLLFTSSGTGAMESAVANLCSPGDRVVVVSAGAFGERWRNLATAYGCRRTGGGVRVGRDTAPGGSEGEARRDRRREGRVPDALGDVHRRRRRRPGAGRGGEAFRGARRRRRRLQPRRRPARDGCLGARRRRLRLAEGADDTAGDRARLGVGGGSALPAARRRASTSTGSGRVPARPSWTARSRRPSPSSAGSTSRSGCCWTRGSRPRSTATSGSVVPAARVPRRWVSSSSRPTRTAPRSSPPSSRRKASTQASCASPSATGTASRSPAATAT